MRTTDHHTSDCNYPPCSCQIADLESQLQDVKSTLDSLMEIVVKADGVIDSVAKEVKPTLDTLMKHPMLKMFIGGK